MTALWPDTFVEEANLSYQISTLRKALGDGAVEWIETVPKHGYRFAAAVTASSHATPAAPRVAAESVPPPAVAGARTRALWLLTAALVIVALVAGTYLTILRPGTLPAREDPRPIAAPLTASPGAEDRPGLLAARGQASPPVMNLNVDLGRDVSMELAINPAAGISPNVERLVVISNRRLLTRRLRDSEAATLAGTEGASAFFFSPDSQFVAFEADGRLKRVAVDGGSVTTLCEQLHRLCDRHRNVGAHTGRRRSRRAAGATGGRRVHATLAAAPPGGEGRYLHQP
jgi:hypothetical protein